MGLEIKSTFSANKVEDTCIQEISKEIDSTDANVVMLFFSPHYDQNDLAVAIKKYIKAPVIGCSSSGEITLKGYQKESVVALSIKSESIVTKNLFIPNLSELKNEDVVNLKNKVDDFKEKVRTQKGDKYKVFSILLVDGMSFMEEELAGSLSQVLGDTPLIGASAGDDLLFENTYVYGNNRFHTNAASLLLIATDHPFKVFKGQNYRPTDHKMIITESLPAKRIVKEINARPAAEVYAELLKKEVHELTPEDFSKNPLMLKIGDDYFIRSIQKVNPDLGLSLYCAIETGLVLTLGESDDYIDSIKRLFGRIHAEVPNPKATILFECILRGVDIKNGDPERLKAVQDMYQRNNGIGLHTFGEQFFSVHMNQTITGVAIGD